MSKVVPKKAGVTREATSQENGNANTPTKRVPARRTVGVEKAAGVDAEVENMVTTKMRGDLAQRKVDSAGEE